MTADHTPLHNFIKPYRLRWQFVNEEVMKRCMTLVQILLAAASFAKVARISGDIHDKMQNIVRDIASALELSST